MAQSSKAQERPERGADGAPGEREENQSSVHLPARFGLVPFRTPAPATPLAPVPEKRPELPDRYEIRDVEEGRFLRCREAPGVKVSIECSHSFSEVEARKLGERTILVDGAGTFGPLIDDAKHLYNLDHHVGCLRAFTLATCEQALVLVLKGVELDKGDWTIYANEPDLDTVLAIWVLLNRRRVRELGPRARDAILPLLRLEGAIDANGFEIAEHCGLPQERLKAEKARIDSLFAREQEAKKEGWPTEVDLVEHTRGMLLEIDKMVFLPSDLSDFTSVEEEYGHVDIGDDKVAVVCRDSGGIYDVEKRLKKTWGDRLGMIALERAPQQYTLRRSASLSGIALAKAYERLNLLDPAVDGRPPEKRWGGSDDIGGSPRPHGTGLVPREIAKILKLTYQQVRPWARLKRWTAAALWTLLVAVAAGLGGLGRHLFAGAPLLGAFESAVDLLLAGGVASLLAWFLTYKLSRGWTWLFGWRWPAGEDWVALGPLVLVAAAVGGVWIPFEMSAEAEPLAMGAGAMVLASLAVALWFPGLVHGLLVLESEIQTVAGRWFVSLPALATGGLYALVSWSAVEVGLIAGTPFPLPVLWGHGAVLAAAFLCGTAAAMIRERSLSIWPALGLLLGGCVMRLLVGAWFTG